MQHLKIFQDRGLHRPAQPDLRALQEDNIILREIPAPMVQQVWSSDLAPHRPSELVRNLQQPVGAQRHTTIIITITIIITTPTNTVIQCWWQEEVRADGFHRHPVNHQHYSYAQPLLTFQSWMLLPHTVPWDKQPVSLNHSRPARWASNKQWLLVVGVECSHLLYPMVTSLDNNVEIGIVIQMMMIGASNSFWLSQQILWLSLQIPPART